MVRQTRIIIGVLLVVAVGLCVGAGSASASTGSDVLFSHADDDRTDIDQHLDDGGLYWQGQSLWIDDPDEEVGDEQLLVREYDTTTDELGEVVETVAFEDGESVIETGSLDGTYVLVPANSRERVISINDGSVNGTVGLDDASPFEVLEQTLDVEWERGPTVTSPADRAIEIESNRVRYNINVSSPELSFEELEAVFMGDRSLREDNEPHGDRQPFAQRHDMYDAHADEDIIVLRGFDDGELSTDFSAVDSFPEAVTVAVTDTGVSRTAGLPSESGVGPFSFSALSIDEQVEPGQQVEIAVTVENEWPTAETEDVVFELGDSSSSVELSLDGEESTTISSSMSAPSTATETSYRVSTSGDEASGTIIVGDPTAETGADNGETDGDDSSVVETAIGLLLPQAVIGAVMTLLSVAAFLVWNRR